MPYFYNNEINVLFIHIPKTGGTSITKYFSKKYNIPLDINSFCGNNYGKKIPLCTDHFILNTIVTIYGNKINKNNLTILVVVRNPYYRIISELFYRNEINVNNTSDEIEKKISIKIDEYLKFFHYFDNHYVPQYRFLCNKEEQLYKNLTILKFENLNNEMHKNGFEDFNIFLNNNNKNVNYMSYLNNNSIQLINKIYKKDFDFFGYEMINTNKNIIN